MNQPIPPESDPQPSVAKPGILQRAENSTMSSGMQAIDGNRNTQIQGDNNWVIHQNFSTYKQTGKNRRKLLGEVKYEVTNRLKSSLHNVILMNLLKESQPQQVKRSWDAEIKSGLKPSFRVADFSNILEIFDQEDISGKLLILGPPGSGKTTALLELAQELIIRAEKQSDQPVPVIFNLSSWKDDHQSIGDWIIAELRSKYAVRSALGREWLEDCQLLPLIDGLDELESARQENCVQEINQFIRGECRPKHIVVCSRSEEYVNYETLLELNGAICLKPLTKDQIYNYLSKIDCTEISQIVSCDPELFELIEVPLFLNITILVYQELSIEHLLRLTSTKDRLEYLLNTYIQRMLERPIDSKAYPNQKFPTSEQTIHWLFQLAIRLKTFSQTEFLINDMQPYQWLLTNAHAKKYRLVIQLTYLLALSLAVGFYAVCIKIFGLTVEHADILTFVLSPFVPLFCILSNWIDEEIKLVAASTWSWRVTKSNLINGLYLALITGLLTFQINGFNGEPGKRLVYASISGLGVLVTYVLGEGLVSSGVETKKVSNQGIRKTVESSVIGGTLGLFCGAVLGSTGGLPSGIAGGIVGGLLGWLFSGAAIYIQHFALRLILCNAGFIPWDYARFLNYATERLLLERVGGRYRFIHTLLQEHLFGLLIKAVVNDLKDDCTQ